MLGNRGGLAPKIDSTKGRNACLLLKGLKCCVSWTLEGDSCAICTGPASLIILLYIPNDHTTYATSHLGCHLIQLN